MDQNGTISDDGTLRGRAPLDADRDQLRAQERARDAALVGRIRGGDDRAFGELYDIWFNRVYDVARRIVSSSDTAAEVAQEAFLSAWRHLDSLAEAASFGGWLLRIARNAALNRAKREARSSPVDAEGMTVIEQQGSSPVSAPAGFDVETRASRLDDPAQVAVDGELVALVHETAAALGERDAEVLRLQLQYQLTPAEVGDVLELNRNAANQLCHRVRNRFASAFGARLVWRGGVPRCDVLRAELTAAGISRFDASAVRVVTAHVERCVECGEERKTRLAPAALFGAVGVVPALASTKMSVAHRLAAHGVPMGGSSAMTGHPGHPGHPGGGFGPSGGPPSTLGMTEGPGSVPTALTAARAAGSPGSASASKAGVVRWAAIAAGVIVVALVVALVVNGRGSSPTQLTRAGGSSSTMPSAGTTDGAAAPSTHNAGQQGQKGGPTGPNSATPGTSDPASLHGTAPATESTTVTTLVPSTTLPTTLTITTFEVTPSTPQPAGWSTASGPVLSWSVSGATDVTIWQHYDDGMHGDQRQRIVAQGLSGSMSLCPGSSINVSSGQLCSAPAGRYSYELVATAEDGSTITAPDMPGFDALAPVIG